MRSRIYIETTIPSFYYTLRTDVASFHRVDILLTWNCAHLANANKIDRLRLLNFEIGLPTPVLSTPLNLLSGGDE